MYIYYTVQLFPHVSLLFEVSIDSAIYVTDNCQKKQFSYVFEILLVLAIIIT